MRHDRWSVHGGILLASRCVMMRRKVGCSSKANTLARQAWTHTGMRPRTVTVIGYRPIVHEGVREGVAVTDVTTGVVVCDGVCPEDVVPLALGIVEADAAAVGVAPAGDVVRDGSAVDEIEVVLDAAALGE